MFILKLYTFHKTTVTLIFLFLIHYERRGVTPQPHPRSFGTLLMFDRVQNAKGRYPIRKKSVISNVDLNI